MAVVPAIDDDAPVRWCTQCFAAYRAEFARCPSDGAVLEIRAEDPLIGATVGEHYVIEGLVGEGGMGRVYRARHTRLQHRQFAIKILLGDLAVAIATRMRFAQEADTASRLDHPNVVPVVDFGKTETGLMYLAMELVSGKTLGSLIYEQAPLAPERVVALARQMCLGLAHAHGLDLIHRDFKPDNVIVVERETGEVPRILDFGLAITYDEEPSAARLTTAGMALGTPAYAAPEQSHGETVDTRADLFALGVTLYEMLTGKTPHDGTALEVIRLNARDAAPPMASRSTAVVPPALEALVSRLLRRKPSDRYASAIDVIAALDTLDMSLGSAVVETPIEIAETLPIAEAVPAAITAPRSTAMPVVQRPSRRRWLVLPAAGVLAAVALVIVSVRSPETKPVPATASNAAPEPDGMGTGSSIPAPAALPFPAPNRPVTKPMPAIAASTTPATEVPPRPTTRPAAKRPNRTAAISTDAAGSGSIAVEPTVPTPVPEPVVVSVPKPAPTPLPAPVTRTLLTQTALTALSSRGSLSTVVVRRAVERTLPEISSCAKRAAVASTTATQTVRATFVIDDSRRASSIAVAGSAALAACVASALANVRTADAPDVGTVTVSLDIGFAAGPT